MRFSPACAGNGIATARLRSAEAVQPRVCGERSSYKEWRFLFDGSAPRVRGTDCEGQAGRSPRRFSPACAGNGDSGSNDVSIKTVQPRVCGERVAGAAVSNDDSGSAPRVRGTAYGGWNDLGQRRFSPACAGNGVNGTRCGFD